MNQNKIFKLLFIVAILLVGVVYSILPHYVRYDTLKSEGERYIPLTQESYFDVMNVLAGRYRNITDGSIFSREVDTYEYKDGPALWPMLSADILAPFFLPFASIFPGLIITDFLFPMLIFLGFFLLIYALTGHRLFSLFSALVLMLFPQLPLLIPPSSLTELKILFLQFLPHPIGKPTINLTYLGRESFIPGAPFFIFFLYFTYLTTNKEYTRKFYVILGGVFYGLLFYLYFYFWVFATIFLSVFILSMLWKKERAHAKSIFFVFLTGLVVSIPFWINQNELTNLPYYWELIERIGLEVGYGVRWFLWKTYLLFIGMAGLSLWLGSRLSKSDFNTGGPFLASLAITSILALNVNVFTGFVPQSDHWSGRVFLITNGIIWAALLYYAYSLLQKYAVATKVKSVLAVGMIIVALSLASNIVYSQITLNKEFALAYTMPENLMEAYAWLNENTPKDSVVMTPAFVTNIDIPVYTHSRIFLARGFTSLAPEEELLERLYMTYALLGIQLEYFDSVISKPSSMLYLFAGRYRSRALDAYLRPWKYERFVYPPELHKKMIREYAKFKVPEEIRYKIDYIFIGPAERELKLDEQILSMYEKVYEGRGVSIYAFKQ